MLEWAGRMAFSAPSTLRATLQLLLDGQFGIQKRVSTGIHRAVRLLILDSAISIECFRNMALRLLVNSAVTLRNSTGDLIVVSLWANSKPNCMLACATSSNFA
jgi:hypothetical protein